MGNALRVAALATLVAEYAVSAGPSERLAQLLHGDPQERDSAASLALAAPVASGNPGI